jgi:hypothetical protein
VESGQKDWQMKTDVCLRNTRIVAALLLSCAGPAMPQAAGPASQGSPAGEFAFRIASAVQTAAAQRVMTGVKMDEKTGDISFVVSSMTPKPGRTFVLLKIVIRNSGGAPAKVAYKDLILKNTEGKPVQYLVLVKPDSGSPMYVTGAVSGKEMAPNETDTVELLLDVPRNSGPLAFQYKSQAAVPIAVTSLR